jgi:acyl carrier protein
MQGTEIRERVRKSVEACLSVDTSPMPDDGHLIAEFGLDSAAILALVSWLEGEFDIVIEDNEIEREVFESLASISDFVAAKLG